MVVPAGSQHSSEFLRCMLLFALHSAAHVRRSVSQALFFGAQALRFVAGGACCCVDTAFCCNGFVFCCTGAFCCCCCTGATFCCSGAAFFCPGVAFCCIGAALCTSLAILWFCFQEQAKWLLVLSQASSGIFDFAFQGKQNHWFVLPWQAPRSMIFQHWHVPKCMI